MSGKGGGEVRTLREDGMALFLLFLVFAEILFLLNIFGLNGFLDL